MNDDFEMEAVDGAAADGARLVVELGAYEGPLDVLLVLAREQKVDLTKISILRLADQYLAFITAAHGLRLEIAADYLVMAAWLAYLKSRLLLPPPADDTAEPTGAIPPPVGANEVAAPGAAVAVKFTTGSPASAMASSSRSYSRSSSLPAK